jgi:hypothetical protein
MLAAGNGRVHVSAFYSFNGKELHMFRIGDRVTVRDESYSGMFGGRGGTVVECPPESKALDEPGAVWVRMDVEEIPGIPVSRFGSGDLKLTDPSIPGYVEDIGPVIASVPHRGHKGEWVVACYRPDMAEKAGPERAYGTQMAWYTGRKWVASGAGDYDLSQDEAIGDMITRSGYLPR